MRVCKIRLLSLAHSCQHIEIGDQPTLVLGQQPRDKRGWGRGTRSNQVLPRRFCTYASRYLHLARTNAEAFSVKIKNPRVGKQLREPNGLMHRLAGFVIARRDGVSKACRVWDVQERGY